jgi:PAS domain S-box-containing protein
MTTKPTYEDLVKKIEVLENRLRCYEGSTDPSAGCDPQNYHSDLLTALLHHTADYILICDEKGTPILFNTAYAKVMNDALGIEMKPGIKPHEFLPDPEAVEYWENLRRRALRGERFRAEYTHAFTEGNARTFEVSYSPIESDHQITGFIELTRDITERRQADEALRESVERFRAIFETAQDFIFLKDKSLNYTHVNPAMEKLFKRPRRELIGKSDEELFGKTAGSHIRKTDSRVLHGEIVHEEHTKPVGEKDIIFSVIKVPIYDHDDKIAGLCGIARDITELEKQKNQLKISEARYRALFDSNPVQTVVVDTTGNITMINFAKERSSGRIPSIGDVMYIDYADKHEIDMHKELMECIHTGNQKSFSELKYKKNYLNVKISPFSEGAIITSEDVTERKRLQSMIEQARKMEAIGQLSGGIAHEFNNILGIILGNAELAFDDIPEDNPAHDFLIEIKNASIRGKEIVRQLLSFSHKSNLKKRAIDIGKVVRESLKFLRASIPRSIEFEENVTDDRITIRGDKTQIHQIMINICNNAAQSIEDPGGKLKICLTKQIVSETKYFAGQQLEPRDYAQLTIEDNGKGIQPESLEKIFDPYYTTKSVGKGTGMGLAVVYGIVKGHGGFIEIKSVPNKGTKVVCYFPITNEVPIDVEDTSEPPDQGHGNILFVDDEASLVLMGKQQLEKLGYDVEAFSDPARVLEKFTANPDKYDLVITDMTMPKMTGDQLIKELRRIRADVKTIICTGYHSRISGKKAAQIGATGCLVKPVERRILADTVRKVLAQP